MIVQLRHNVWPDILRKPLHQIIASARWAAAQQPDGTRGPEVCVLVSYAWHGWGKGCCQTVVVVRLRDGVGCQITASLAPSCVLVSARVLQGFGV